MPSNTLQYSSRGHVISGMVGQQHVHCLLHPAQPGTGPPPGVYRISAPIQNPVYGTLLVLVLNSQVRQRGAASASAFDAFLHAFQGAHASFFLPAAHSIRESANQPEAAAPVFVISNQGSRVATLVAGAGFEALAAALRQSGGANLVIG